MYCHKYDSPHEKLFNVSRKSNSRKSIPSRMKAGPVYIRNRPKFSKGTPPVVEATRLHANPQYAHVRLPSGVETTVNIRDLSPQF